MRPVCAICVVGAALVALPLLTAPAWGIVVHSDIAKPSDWPADDLVARWNTAHGPGRGSAVVVGPNHVITARHIDPDGGVGTLVSLRTEQGPQTYRVAEVFDAPASGGTNVDLRVARLTTLDGAPANLAHWAPLYTGSVSWGMGLVLAGYGKGRGQGLDASGTPYGYGWEGDDNDTLRWGANSVDAQGTAVLSAAGATYATQSIFADFDTAAAGVTNEATLAEWDSGGGWFVQDEGLWKLAAVSLYHTDHQGTSQSWFGPPEWLVGARVGAYEGFITDTVPEPATLLILGVGGTVLLSRRRPCRR